MLSRVRFGSFLAYCPRSVEGSREIESSQSLVHALKKLDRYRGEPVVQLGVRRLVEERPDEVLDLLGPATLVVPMPGSSPIPDSRTLKIPLRGRRQEFLWPAREICRELVAQGLAVRWTEALVRCRAVARSSRAAPADRPRPLDHYESLEVPAPVSLLGIERVVLVDDVITRGATLLGAASRLQESVGPVEVSGFALVRTISDPVEFSGILNPVSGVVSLRDTGDTLRRP